MIHSGPHLKDEHSTL